jgi:hypothetical protein
LFFYRILVLFLVKWFSLNNGDELACINLKYDRFSKCDNKKNNNYVLNCLFVNHDLKNCLKEWYVNSKLTKK